MPAGGNFMNEEKLLKEIEKMWESLFNIDCKNMPKIQSSRVILLKKEILSLVKAALNSENKVLVENVTALVLAIYTAKNPELDKFKKEIKKIYRKNKNKRYVKENYCFLKSLP